MKRKSAKCLGFPAMLGLLATLFLLPGSSFADGFDEFEDVRTSGGSSRAGSSIAVGAPAKTGSLEAPADEQLTREKASELGFKLPSNADAEYEYRIGAHDVLEIEVFQVEELQHAARVSSRGYISVPLLGPIKVGGLSVQEAETLIADGLGKDYLQDPHVSIFVSEYESQKFTVEGEIKDPGVYPIKGPTTLLQAIAMADGVGKLADTEEVVLFRKDVGTGKTAGFIVNIERLRTGEKEDPLMANGDVVVVPTSGSKAFIDSFSSTLRGFIGFGAL